MLLRRKSVIPFALALSLCACSWIPPKKPEVLAMPGPNKGLEEFDRDNAWCRLSATEQLDRMTGTTGTTSSQVANQRPIRGEATVVDSAAGGPVASAAIDDSPKGRHRRFNSSYVECMSSKGHRIPDLGRLARY